MQLVVQGDFLCMGAMMSDLAAATTTDGATTYQVNAGPGGPSSAL